MNAYRRRNAIRQAWRLANFLAVTLGIFCLLLAGSYGAGYLFGMAFAS